MSIFSKTITVEAVLPFELENPTDKDKEACVIGIEAYGYVLDTYKFFYAAFSFKPNIYDELIEVLKEAKIKKVKIIAKTKKGVVKKFKVDFDFLAEEFQNEKFKKASIVVSGTNDNSAIRKYV